MYLSRRKLDKLLNWAWEQGRANGQQEGYIAAQRDMGKTAMGLSAEYVRSQREKGWQQ